MNRKGQALIEFVLILPVFIFILFAIIDFGIIFNSKSNLESISSDIISLFKEGTPINELQTIYDDVSINISSNSNYHMISITKKINLITPGLNKVLGDPYLINVERVIPNA